MKELLLTNSFFVANKRTNNLRELVTHADPYNIKMDLLESTDHDYKKCRRKCDSWHNLFF